jgi:Spy/CpxP family protein refolding chaperone
MKNLIVMSACLFSMTTVMNAQQPTTINHPQNPDQHAKDLKRGTPEQRAQKSVDELNSTVVLTDDQKTKVYALALTRVKDIDVVKAKYKGQEDKKQTADAEIKVIRKTFHEGVKALLTPDQLAKFKAAKEEKHKEGANKEGASGEKD